jgi:hypothetical protein
MKLRWKGTEESACGGRLEIDGRTGRKLGKREAWRLVPLAYIRVVVDQVDIPKERMVASRRKVVRLEEFYVGMMLCCREATQPLWKDKAHRRRKGGPFSIQSSSCAFERILIPLPYLARLRHSSLTDVDSCTLESPLCQILDVLSSSTSRHNRPATLWNQLLRVRVLFHSRNEGSLRLKIRRFPGCHPGHPGVVPARLIALRLHDIPKMGNLLCSAWICCHHTADDGDADESEDDTLCLSDVVCPIKCALNERRWSRFQTCTRACRSCPGAARRGVRPTQ